MLSAVSNLRPISKLLPFLSKLLEKVVLTQLLTCMKPKNVFEEFQSGFRALHSTEPFLLNASNDLLLPTDRGESEVLIPLDLSIALTL